MLSVRGGRGAHGVLADARAARVHAGEVLHVLVQVHLQGHQGLLQRLLVRVRRMQEVFCQRREGERERGLLFTGRLRTSFIWAVLAPAPGELQGVLVSGFTLISATNADPRGN